MGSGYTTVPDERPTRLRGVVRVPELVAAFELAWSAYEPERTGEWILFLRDGEWVIGRGDRHPKQLRLVKDGPGVCKDTGSLLHAKETRSMSRDQLVVHVRGTDVTIENNGDIPMLVNGVETRKAKLEPGYVVEILDRYLFLFTLRPSSIPACSAWPHEPHAMGEPDKHGMVGDSPSAWAFRELLARVALSHQHVLLLGETGVGKELAAVAIYCMSERGKARFIVVNSATLTPGLIDTELFGHRAHITDGKMPAAIGLVEAAEGGILFLDEIGEISAELQKHLLRALEGSYRRVGENVDRRSNVRWICATNRSIDKLVGDIVGRLKLVIDVPSLDARREDLPALIRSRVLRVWNENPKLVARFIRIFPGKREEIAIEPELVTALLRHHYTLNVRELDALLEKSFITSVGNTLQPPPELMGEIPAPSKAAVARALAQAALDEHIYMDDAAAALGISRYALGRRLRRY